MTSLTIIKEKTWLVGLICALFVIYPNAAWLFCRVLYNAENVNVVSWYLFSFRVLYVWGVFVLLIKWNLKTKNNNFIRGLFSNVVASMVLFAIYWLVRMPFRVPELMSIPIFQFLVAGLTSALIGYIYKLYTGQQEKDKEIERLQIESLQSRCDALTNQINPHFFFNSLNGISSLIRMGGQERTLAYVDRLSDIFRYTLQSDKKTLVTLEEELSFVEAFSHVMQERFANKLTFKVDIDSKKYSLQLPVLTILPLLENITVHNTIDSEHRMEVEIGLNPQDELVVSNPIYPKLTPPETNGTGLKNLENRFRLMMGKEIRIVMTEERFTVILPLK